MKKLILIPLLLLLACNVAKHEVAKMEVYAVRYPDQFKILANTLDPCFSNTVIHSDTIIKEGKRDTVLSPGSTVITRIKDTVIKTITLPGKVITVPLYKTIIKPVPVTDNRALSASNAAYRIKADSLIISNTKLKQTAHSRDIWMWIAIGALVLIIIGAVISVYKFLKI